MTSYTLLLFPTLPIMKILDLRENNNMGKNKLEALPWGVWEPQERTRIVTGVAPSAAWELEVAEAAWGPPGPCPGRALLASLNPQQGLRRKLGQAWGLGQREPPLPGTTG